MFQVKVAEVLPAVTLRFCGVASAELEAELLDEASELSVLLELVETTGGGGELSPPPPPPQATSDIMQMMITKYWIFGRISIALYSQG